LLAGGEERQEADYYKFGSQSSGCECLCMQEWYFLSSYYKHTLVIIMNTQIQMEHELSDTMKDTCRF